MNFLYPSFLWGLLALAIPIIVHLFNFKRAKKIYFSNVSFLENVKESSSSKLKLKYLLVLACRLLVITFLVLAFAQPFLPGNEDGMDGSLVKIYLDNSQSNSNLDGNDVAGLNTGIAFTEAIINLYPTQTQFQIYSNDFDATSTNPKSKERALELITELEYSNLVRSKKEVMTKLDVSTNQSSKQDVFLISDFQRSSFDTNESIKEDSISSFKILPIEFPNHNNIYVDTIFLESPFLLSGEINKLHVRVKNVGDIDTNDTIIKLFVSEEQAASASLDISKNSSAEIVFDLNFKLADINSCKITFEDFPITFDNEYYFVLNLLKKINIVEIHASSSLNYISQVYSENDLFNYQSLEEGSIDYGTVQACDLLIINQLSAMDNSIINVAKSLVEQGRSVFVISAGNPDINGIQNLLGQEIRKLDAEDKIELENPDIINPFFDNIFTDIDNKTEMPTANPVISWKKVGTDLLNSKNGLPFLTRVQRKGSLYLLSSPLIDNNTSFHKHALFVPILYRMAALSSNSYYPLSYSIDNPFISIKLDSIATDKLYKLTRGEEEYIPEQRINGNNLILDLPKFLLTPGFYNLNYGGTIKNVLAFNYSKSESDPTQLSSDEIAQAFGPLKNMEIMQIDDAESLTKEMKEKYEGIQLWKYALILSLIFLLTETLFLRFL